MKKIILILNFLFLNFLIYSQTVEVSNISVTDSVKGRLNLNEPLKYNNKISKDTTVMLSDSLGIDFFAEIDELVLLDLDSIKYYDIDSLSIGDSTVKAITTGDTVLTTKEADNRYTNISFGTSNQIAFMNTGGTDLNYSSNFSFTNDLTLSLGNGFGTVSIGQLSGKGTNNVFLGENSGKVNTSNSNVIIGKDAGFNSISFGNVFIGYQAGYYETGINKFYLTNKSGANLSDGIDSTLIYGEFDNKYVKINDSLGIAKSIKFNGNADENYSKGKTYYDTTDQSLVFFNDQTDFKWQISREIPVRFYNNTGGTIPDGTVIRSVGSKVNGTITFRADIAGNGSLDSLQGVALTTVETLDGEFGEATLVGQVNNLNTSAFSDNDLLYIGHNGALTNVNPEPPLFSTIVARVVYSDVDSGAIYFFPVGETRYRPNPTFTARFEDSTEVITNPGVGEYELITSATNSLFGEIRNVGFTFQGDSISPMQGGNYTTFFSYSFQGTAAQTDLYRIAVFIDGVKQYSTSRTASGANNGGVPFPYTAFLTAGQWISFRISNQTTGIRDCTFTDGTITINFSQ